MYWIPPRFVLLLCLVTAGLAHAAEVPYGHRNFYPSPERPMGWRGDGNGAYPGATPVSSFHEAPAKKVEARLRDTWNEPKTRKYLDVGDGPAKNIVWQTRLPAWAHSQPIIVGDKVFTVAEPHSLICIDMHTGKILWERTNSPFELMGMPENEVAALEDYIARAYAARVPIAARTGNYRRLPGHTPRKWSEKFLAPVLDECGLAEKALRELIKENPHGKKAEPALNELLGMVKKIKALKPGDKSKKLGKPLVGAMYRSVDWIEKEHKVPCLYGWDGFIGWTFATPISDGKRVYASMGQGQVVCYDLDGNRIWGHRVPNLDRKGNPLSGHRTPSVRANHVPSPCLADGVLVAQAPDQLVAFDAQTGRMLWKDSSIRVGGGYRVSTHKPLKLKSGRWILITTKGRALDVKTGKMVCDFGVASHGSEGAGASITGKDGVAYIVGAPQKKRTGLYAVRFSEQGGAVKAETIWSAKSDCSGQSPVLFGDHIYRFTGRRREDKDVFAIADGSPVSRIYERTGGTSPSLIGSYFFTYDNDGTRERIDKRNVVGISVVQLTAPGKRGGATTNPIDETEPPPDWRVEKFLPEVYERIKANKEPPIWPQKPWRDAWWGKCGGVPDGFGVGGFCASGNRVVLRTISNLICIGDPGTKYDWNPASRTADSGTSRPTASSGSAGSSTHQTVAEKPKSPAKADPARARQWLRWATRYLKTGREPLARSLLNNIVEQYPDSQAAAKAERMLGQL